MSQLVTARALRYAVAVLAVSGAALARWTLQPLLGDSLQYLLFVPAVMVAGWYGGFGPAALATGLSCLGAMYLFLPPDGLAVQGLPNLLSLALFALTGLAIGALNHRLRSAELALRATAALATARAERLAAIINTSVDGIIVISSRGIVEAFNRGAERLFGYPESDVLGRNVNMLMPSPHHDEHDGYLDRYLRTGSAHIIGKGREVEGRRRDGSVFTLHLSVAEMEIDGERKFTGMLHDLTDRVQLEEQLRTSEARWRAVIDSAVDGIIVIDARGRIESFNPAAERLFGYTEAEVVGRNVHVLMPSPYQEEHDNYLGRYLSTGQARIIGIGREVAGQRKDGSTFPIHLSVGEINLAGERKFTGIVHDLSGRVAMETQLREQTSMARLGEMSAVIAHEIKNPLAGIRGAIEVIGWRLPGGSADSGIVQEILGRIDSLNQMMKDLLLFARPPRPKWAPVDVIELAKSTVDLARRDPALAQIVFSVSGESPEVVADADMLKVVLHNLLINSGQALEGRGRITIEVGSDDSICQLVVSDDGPGIKPEIVDKVFTPFFTTKSRGSGLGLPTAKRVIEAHRGQIHLQCPPGGGTKVTIRLPFRNE